MLGALTFLTPRGALLALVAAAPLAALAVAALRSERAARVLGLRPASRRALARPAAAATLAFLFFGLAAAQPSWRTEERHRVRTSSQVLFVVDVSRSMAAADSRGGTTRLGRARLAVAQLRAAVPDVPAGIAGLTDRVLPYVFPTLDATSFSETLRRSVTIESPPPQQVSTNATSFAALASVARDNFFTRGTQHRTCVVVTDGETRSYSVADVVGALDSPRGCRLLLVRVGGGGERVFGPDGSPEGGYASDPAAAANAQALAGAAGGSAFAEGDLGAAADALRRAADAGPEGKRRASVAERALALPAAALGALALAALLASRIGRLPLRLIFTDT